MHCQTPYKPYIHKNGQRALILPIFLIVQLKKAQKAVINESFSKKKPQKKLGQSLYNCPSFHFIPNTYPTHILYTGYAVFYTYCFQDFYSYHQKKRSLKRIDLSPDLRSHLKEHLI